MDYYKITKKFIEYNDRMPVEATFEISFRCNLNCVHCYCNDPSLKKKGEELTFEEICRIIDEIADEGCFWILFTGGEPFIREDFPDLYLYAKKKGFICAIFTNATLMDKKKINLLKEYPPYEVSVSLYGITEKTYEGVTRVKGSFKKAMRGIRILHEHKIPLEIKTMVLNINKHEIKKMHEFAEGLGARFRYDPLIYSKLNRDKSPCNFRLNAAECTDLDMELNYIQSDWRKQCAAYSGISIDRERLYICGAGQNTFVINPYGKLQTCGLPGKYTYNLKKGTFKEGWYDFMPKVINRKRLNKDFKCLDCDLRGFCAQCPNLAYLENNNEEKIVDYICALFKERTRRFVKKNTLRKETQNATK